MPTAPLVVVNPAAGGGRAARFVPWLHERLAARPDVDLAVTRRRGDAERLAADAVGEGRGRVIAVGGDGTIQEVVNGLLARNGGAGIGIVPLGSGNDLARSLGLPRDPAAAWSVAIGSAERRIDVAAAEAAGRRRWFTSAGGIGFDAQVAAAMASRAGWQRGQAGYLLTTLAELRRFSNRRVEISVDGHRTTRSVLLVAIANGEYYGGGMRIAPGAAVDDGRLDVCIVGDVSRLTALRQLANLYRGTHVDHPQVDMAGGRAIEIAGDAETLVHLDGEPFGRLPLTVRLHQGALLVAAPAARPAPGFGRPATTPGRFG